MSEPKPIKDIILDIAIDKSEPIGNTLVKCPIIQAELIKCGHLNLEDLTDKQIHDIIEHTFLEEWIDGQSVMLMLHISPRTLQSLRYNGTLPFSRVGGKIFYRRHDIQKILADNYTMYKIRNEYGNNE